LHLIVVGLIAIGILARAQPPTPHQNLPNDLQASEQAIAQTLKARPSAAAWERLGLIRHLQNHFQDAIPAFRQAIRLDSARWASHLFLGICLYRTNDFAAALLSLEAAEVRAQGVQAGRDDLDYWLGATRIAMKRPLAGLRDLERLLQRNPTHADALELAVRSYADAGTAAWNEVADKHFETAPGYEIHGHALESEGNRKGATAAFQQSKVLNPKRAGPGLAMGRSLLLEGRAQDALELLQQELKLPDVQPEALHYAGLAAVQLARYSEAAAWLEKASEWGAQNPESAIALTQVYLALNDVQKAATTAAKAVAANPLSAAAHDLAVAMFEKAGRHREAEAETQRWTDLAKR